MSPSKSTVEAGTTARTGLRCYAIRVITAATFTTLTGVTGGTGFAFPADFLIKGNITAFTLSSGSVIFYEL